MAYAIVRAARRWRVPLWVLVGVKLAETGSDPTAANPFQFEPGTARSAGVRDVNNPNQAANGAAKLLHSYYRQFGSWNAAFEAYNGGPGAVGKGYAYDQAHIESKLAEYGTSKADLGGDTQLASFGLGDLLQYISPLYRLFHGEAPLPKFPGVPGLPNPLGKSGLEGGLGEAGQALADIAKFFGLLTTTEFWVRLFEILAGAALIYMGLKSLTGVSASDVPGARTARRAGEAAAFKRLPPKMRTA